MSKRTLPYQETGYFSSLICDYLAQDEKMNTFYDLYPSEQNFLTQIQKKSVSYYHDFRKKLVGRLKAQYNGFSTSELTLKNIESLLKTNTFTITTGHQLNLFTGPLYFLYKIFSVINLTEKLNNNHPDYRFVPIYWMATEDHDFDEINYFNLNGKKLEWNHTSGGAVGELDTEGLDSVLTELEKELGQSYPAKKLSSLFSEAYLKHSNLADATRYLANQLFSEYGLVIIDGNDKDLKEAFIPFAEKELLESLSYKKVSETTKELVELGYKEQVHPREINLFYLKDGLRERIIEKDGKYFINDTDLEFSEGEILKELQEQPERFSPNALLRPLYQEIILPNLCYVGGGGELAYWFQLKDYFESVKCSFPILLLRNSALLVSEKLSEKLKKLDVEIELLFLPKYNLETTFTKKISEIDIDFSKQREHLVEQFKDLYTLAEQTDASFEGAVGAQEKKQLNGLDNLEKRLLKAQKRKLSDQLSRLTAIQDELFPKASLQERTVNFSQFYQIYGEKLFSEIKESLDPLSNEFTLIILK